MSSFSLSRIDDLWGRRPESYRPTTTLREGVALDSLQPKPEYDDKLDYLSERYIEKYINGLTFVDRASLDFYFPYLIRYAYHHYPDESSVVIDDLFWMIQSKFFLDCLSPEQKKAIVEFLGYLQDKSFKYKIDDIIDCVLENGE
jgi:hypothetical protein